MTVRVNKDSFNLREKLSELERPIGLKGSELMSVDTAQEARDLVSAGRKNLIINGGMAVAQRGTSTAVAANAAYYTVDRFLFFQGISLSNATVTGTQQSVSDLPGHTKSFRVTNVGNAAITSTTDGWIKYNVEDKDFDQVNWLNGSNKSVTLSFWAKSNRTGQFSVALNSGTFASAKNIKTYTLDFADTWKKIEVTYPAPSAWSNHGNKGARIYWPMATGTTYYTSNPNTGWMYNNSKFGTVGDTQIHGDDGAYFEITGVQLEVGKNATDFEHRSYGEELALCQRYYQQHTGNSINIGPWFFQVDGYSAAYYRTTVHLPTSMRAFPSVTWTASGTIGSSSQYGTQFVTETSFTPYTNAGSGSIHISGWTASAEL